MSRAVTFEQFKKIKVKNWIKMLVKYRDYDNAILLVEELGKKKLLS
jgi:hypothetical protein